MGAIDTMTILKHILYQTGLLIFCVVAAMGIMIKEVIKSIKDRYKWYRFGKQLKKNLKKDKLR